jgi:hypothetical protein
MGDSHWDVEFDRWIADTKWILSTEAAAVFTEAVADFHEKGWPKPIVIAGTPGTGPQPDPEHAEVIILNLDESMSETPMLSGIRAFDAALRYLPEDVLSRIRAWDPEGEAKVLTSFLDYEFELDGRPTVGARPKAWTLLEDKLIVDHMWDLAGVRRAPSVVVPIDQAQTAASDLDRGAGTVWACDTTEGWHGGGEYLRWVRSEADAEDALAFMLRHGSMLRVMPFLEGVPTSIHGMVFPDYVAAFRPIELQTVREGGTSRLRYTGTSSTWDPPDDDRAYMRDAAKRFGRWLQAEHGYRGVFTIDGVLTVDGFLPTELNPRFGAGLFAVASSSGLPLLGLHRALIQRADLDYRPQELESAAMEGGDRQRMLRGIYTIAGRPTETEELRVDLDGSRIAVAVGDGHGTLSLGPASHGALVMVRVDPAHTPAGVRAAPITISALELARDHWDLDIPDLEPAPDVRSAGGPGQPPTRR